MPNTTPELALPYPIPDDSVDVPRDIKALADALDARLGGGGGAAGGALVAAPVLDVGMAGQIRAGRQLTAADFTALGLAAPVGLWNLSDLTDASGNARALTNKGAVPFGVGINGAAASCAVFAGSTAQALYIADTGAADPFRIRTGSWGCWFRTAKRATVGGLISKYSAAVRSWTMGIQSTGSVLGIDIGTGGDATANAVAIGVSDVADDRWHFGVATYDGTALRLYVDAILEAAASWSGVLNAAAGGPLNIGGFAADAATATVAPHYGRVDEAFVTADVLSDDQIRALYCAKIAHGYATTPTRINLNVRRRKRGGALAVADFSTQPLRLYNFSAGALTDQGSGNVALTATGTPVSVVGVDGASGGSYFFGGSGSLQATDAGLPAALTARSYGCWFKTSTVGTNTVVCWGTFSTADARLEITNVTSLLTAYSGSDGITGLFVGDGQWHFAVVVEDNAAGDGVRRKLYLDGRLIGGSTVLNAITLAGANRLRIGSRQDGATGFFTGQIDGVFVCGYALTATDVAALYAKGSQALAPSPKEPGAHVEAMDATNVLAAFDTLDTTAQIDMGVAA